MNDSKSIRCFTRICFFAALLWLPQLGCGPSVEESDDRSLLDALGEDSLAPVDEPLAVPDGTTDELIQFIDEIQRDELSRFDGASQGMTDEYVRALNRVMEAQVTACDKILSSDDDPRIRVSASRTKLQALQTLAMLNGDEDQAARDAFVASLNASEDAELQRLVVISEFEWQVNAFISSPDKDVSTFLSQLDAFLQQPDAATDVFETTRHAAGVVFQSGNVSLSADILQRLGEQFRDHDDPSLAADAIALVGEAVQLRIAQKVDAALAEEPKSISELLDTVRQGLTDVSTRDDVTGYALQAALTLESRGQFDSANEVYCALQDHYADTDSELSASLNRSVQLAEQRMELIGKPLTVDGVLLDGEPFDWDAYRGSHVVVCFWQSWHSGWVNEVRKLRQTVAPFRDQGVKIVTINLDDDRNALERNLQETPLSLPIILNPDPSAPGFENPNALRCGVEAVPYTLLVDPAGIVIDIHSRGERLRAALQKQLSATDNAQQAISSTLLRYIAFQSPAEDGDDELEATEVDSEQTSLEEQLKQANPYAPPAEASPLGLIEFILEMQDKPRSIQRREGFSAGIVTASDRVIASDAKDRWKTLALLAKTKYLHRDASLGDAAAEQALSETVEKWKADPREEIASEIRFLRLEQRALQADESAPEELPQLLQDLSTFFEQQSLDARHLRLASQSVHLVNRLDATEREPYFQRLSEQFAKSEDKQLAAYGNRIAKSASPENVHLNELLTLAGVTADGARFDWDSYRGNWVVVDFWATWCGPCRQAMPALRQLAVKHQDQGLQVVGVSLDEDLKALAEFLAKEELPWTNIVGGEAGEIAKKYGVRAIPNLMLVDGEGRIRFVSHKVEEMAKRVADEVGVGT